MADPARRRAANADGPLYVDDTCIDCGTCMWMAPDVYEEVEGMSAVVRQPTATTAWTDAAVAAIAACPTGSIGHEDPKVGKAAFEDFPRMFAPDVWHCGFHARASFGAASWLFRTEAGNVMVDSPRFSAPLVKRIEAMGSIDHMLLTHRDDVADHAKWADRFGCTRVLHADDVTDATRDVEVVLEGSGAMEVAPGILAIPTPGHTKGSTCYLWKEFLFTGDHLCAGKGALRAFRRACWYDWKTQTKSMARLLDHRFHTVLPGHGAPAAWDEATMHARLDDLVKRMAVTA